MMISRHSDTALAALYDYCSAELAPRAAQIDEANVFVPDVLRDLARIGQQRLHLEQQQIDWRPSTWLRIHQASKTLARYSTALAVATSVARLHSYLLIKYAASEVCERWLEKTLNAEAFGSFAITEPQAGTDIRAMETIAVETKGGFRLSGRKRWIGLAPIADYSIVLAKLDSASRKARTIALVVDLSSQGVSRVPELPLSGLRGMPNGGLDFENVFVPAESALACDGFMGMMDGLNLARIEAASYSCGLIQRAVELSIERTASREIFGESLLDKQLTQQRIGQMHGDYLVADTMTIQAAHTFAKGDGGCPETISAAKLFATDKAREHTDTAMQFWGAQGLILHSDVERMHRDAKVMQIFDGTSEIHQLMLAKHAIRHIHD
ncbi:acyl-CoA dehydrogenase family protein [Halomonas dongshanensis]|uniref:Acyl-CoA dehydrogenase n=1 Tax=Halomonas dongshanensis TaxID=2890835 RepID=A0ABT2EB04_9GAMM|nr:acyl-CoA dehydrogenase family protein [Halomonas dongshanensis]MCS2608730.1 acyl-CoA dehydrogenase [Halomonas dongshanensis]